MLKNLGKGTTAWLATTLTSAGGMIGATIYAANTMNANCYSAAEAIKTFAESQLVTPVINTNFTFTLPDLIGMQMTVPVAIPSVSIAVASLLSDSSIAFLKEVPDYVGQICRAEMAMHGTAYTGIIVGLAALTTYAYAKNHQLTMELANKANNASNEDSHLINTNPANMV